MSLPPTGSQISINQVQTAYGYADENTRSLSQLGTDEAGITSGNPVSLSATFGGTT
tara:strand:- start:3372 stop:3539 length:168 start_codon:yes stop_codon:yes gene_type:complete